MAGTKRKSAPRKSTAKKPRAVVSKSSGPSSLLGRFSARTKLFFVAAFVVVGGAAIYASFADTPTDILVGMGDAGSYAAQQNPDGSITVSNGDGGGPSLSFQITSDNVLQCTNTNSGNVTTAQLTADQTSSIANQMIAAGIQSQSDSIIAKGQGVLESTWVTVNTNGVNKTVNITGTAQSTPFGRAASAVARDACKQATKPVKADKVSVGKSDKELTKAQGDAIAQKIEDALNAKAYADTGSYNGVYEAGQYVGINWFRDNNGVSYNLKSTLCLRNSARVHSMRMGDQNTMSHQLPGEPSVTSRISNNCGGWIYAGENIGWNSDTSLNGVAFLIDLMGSEKAPENGHRLNMLSTHYTNYGAGAYYDATTHKVWITEDFASGLPAPATTYDPVVAWGLTGVARVSTTSTGAESANISARSGSTVYFRYRVENTGPSRATFSQYHTITKYSPTGTLASTSNTATVSGNGVSWGDHGDPWPASTTQYAFSGRYYADYTAGTETFTIPAGTPVGTKFCRSITVTNATGPSTGAAKSNNSCVTVSS